MSHDQFDPTLREAVQYHQGGRLAEAEAAYRRALQMRPDQAHVLQMLGVLVAQRGSVEEGLGLIRRAIAISPGNGGIHANLGYVLAASGRTDEAIAAFHRAVQLSPQDPDARLNLARALQQSGRLDQAATEYQEAFRLRSPAPEMLGALGTLLQRLKRFPEAIECFTKAWQQRPDSDELFDNLCALFSESSRSGEAETFIRQALATRPNSGLGWFRLGILLYGQQRYDEAIEAYRQCLAIEPSTAARHNLWMALRQARRPREAIAQYQTIISPESEDFDARNQMGLAHWDLGELEQAAPWFRRALELKGDPEVESGLIYTLHFLPDVEPGGIRAALARWNERYAKPLAPQILPHTNDPKADRPLRVGYVARHLGDHPVGRFLLQLLSHHDRDNFRVFCYCDDGTDPIGLRLRGHVDVWRTTLGASDEALAEQIRADKVDILIDLMMHVGSNRLMAFARKPAPVQVAYLAHPGGTGLGTMDYRLTDPFLDPPGRPDEFPYEKAVRLPATFWCYFEPTEAPPVGALPADTGGGVTFGCLNNDNKINGHVIAAWARVLAEVPSSRFTLYCPNAAKQERIAGPLSRHGVDLERIRFVGWRSLQELFAEYNRIDIALDTFPYPGGTTSLDALYMGVPVVTLGGQTSITRGGVSILSNLGLGSLVTWDVDQYVRTAAELARDLPRIRSLRSSLRNLMRGSPLMDGPRFARDVEAAYRSMWRNWCTEVAQHRAAKSPN